MICDIMLGWFLILIFSMVWEIVCCLLWVRVFILVFNYFVVGGIGGYYWENFLVGIDVGVN